MTTVTIKVAASETVLMALCYYAVFGNEEGTMFAAEVFDLAKKIRVAVNANSPEEDGDFMYGGDAEIELSEGEMDNIADTIGLMNEYLPEGLDMVLERDRESAEAVVELLRSFKLEDMENVMDAIKAIRDSEARIASNSLGD